MRVAKNRAWGSAQRFLEGRRRHGLERQRKDVAVGTEALESPGEMRLRGDALGAAGGNDAEEDAGAVSVLMAMGTPRSARSRRVRSSGVSSQNFWYTSHASHSQVTLERS